MYDYDELTKRYQMVTVYNDFSTKSESTNNLSSALGAAAVYMGGRDVIRISIYDWKTRKEVFDWDAD